MPDTRCQMADSRCRMADDFPSAIRYLISAISSRYPESSSQHSAPTACRRTVSGSISLPSRGSFHLSLTVLVHYRWQKVFSLTRWSWQIHTGFLVSRVTWVLCKRVPSLSPTGLSPSVAGLSMPFG